MSSTPSSGTVLGSGCSRDYRAASRVQTATSRPYTRHSRPRTGAGSSVHHENAIIGAISEARGISPTIGVCFLNLTTAEAVLSQFTDTQTFARACHKIRVFDPMEMLFSDTAADSKLLSILQENLGGGQEEIGWTAIHRRYWAETVGHDYMNQFALPEDLEVLTLAATGSYFAVCCFAAVMTYADLELQTTFASHTLRIKFEPSEGAMMIDLSTMSSLELIQNLHDSKSKDCLFGLVNRTKTKMGHRILKSNVLQPSTDIDKVKKRHEVVAELSSREDILVAVRAALDKFVDTDKLLAALVIERNKLDFAHMEHSVNYILMLKAFTDSIPQVWQALASVESEALREIRQLCSSENYLEVSKLIHFALNEDVSHSTNSTELRNQRVWAIKEAGVNGFLDVARKTYKEFNEDVVQLVDSLIEQHGIGLRLKFDTIRQYYLSCKVTELSDSSLPDVFINVFPVRNNIECQTMDLVKLNQKIKDSHNEVIAMSNHSVQELIEQVRAHMHPLFKVSESIAMLDMLSGFAHLAVEHRYIQPDLNSTLAIKSGRHPILEQLQSNARLIANDVYATEQTRFQIVTGCNMSGKSTYIRSIALMIVMAQIGCFLPADYASLPMVSQIFARVSMDNNLEASVSSFALEMREMAFILHNIEPHGVVIVDELGRGTSTVDGLAIAIAISEALIESKAYVWFVTHFRELPRILAERAGVVNLHFVADIAPDMSAMQMTYKISEGYEEQKYYGLALAKVLNFPHSIVKTAKKISEELNARNEARQNNVKTLAIAKRRKLVLKLREQLLQARESAADDDTLREWLKRLQEEFTIRMSAIDAEVTASETNQDAATSSVRATSEQSDVQISDDC